ncbi:hypothetical protein [Micromonospora sp. NPDC048063]|uniref:hypothetical protein n=1 Tax=Micromonospora sp. NPDC048063 TaxID=3364256 RepID=UPI003714A7B4
MTALVGLWLVATEVLRRPVATSDPYPHLCGVTHHGTRSGTPYRYSGRDCAACHHQLTGGPKTSAAPTAPKMRTIGDT